MTTAGEEGKKSGMDRAERAADTYWWQCMLESAKAVAERKPYFFTDDIVRWCQYNHPNASTHEHRAIGPLMRQVFILGYAVPTQDYVPSEQPQCHRRPMRVWYSLIYRGRLRPKLRRRTVIDPRQFDLGI